MTSVPPSVPSAPPPIRDPYLRFLKRLLEIHSARTGTCPKCDEPVPCDTMRAAWVYDMERDDGHMVTEYEMFELRRALGFHFDNCDGREELDEQLGVVNGVVDRILSRRFFAAQAQTAIDGMAV